VLETAARTLFFLLLINCKMPTILSFNFKIDSWRAAFYLDLRKTLMHQTLATLL